MDTSSKPPAAATHNAKTRSPGRPRAFDQEQALEQALRVFWQKGYEGTSLSDLTEALGINRPSLYAAFGNKENLFRQALKRYGSGPAAYMGEVMQEPTARGFVEKLLLRSAELLSDPACPNGCMVVQGALACSDESQAIRQELADCRLAYQARIQQRLQRAQQEGDLDASLDAADLARYVATIHQGMSVQASSGATLQQLQRLVALVMRQWPG